LKSHATLIKIFIDGCSSVQFDWINKDSIALTIQEPTQVTSCCDPLAPIRQLSFNSRSARMSFFTSATSVHFRILAGNSLLLDYQNDLRDTFSDSPVPNKSTVSRLVNRFRDTGSVLDRNRSGRPSVLNDDSLDDIRQTLLRCARKSRRKLSLQSSA
jgi:hypothetical protein